MTTKKDHINNEDIWREATIEPMTTVLVQNNCNGKATCYGRNGVLPARVGETGARCYRGRLLQRRFMQKYHIDGEIADSSCIRIHQGNH